MTKTEIIREIAKNTGQSVKDTAAVIDAFLYEIKEMVSSGGSVEIAGFGNFKIAERAEKKVRLPRTGEERIIPAHKVPRFSPAKAFKDILK